METRELFLAENVLFYSWGVLVSLKGRWEFVVDDVSKMLIFFEHPL